MDERDERDEMNEMIEMNEIYKIYKMYEINKINKIYKGKLTTDNPLSNRGAMAICCRVFFLSGAEETVKLGLCFLYSSTDPQRAK